jgi:hypothetical protein
LTLRPVFSWRHPALTTSLQESRRIRQEAERRSSGWQDRPSSPSEPARYGEIVHYWSISPKCSTKTPPVWRRGGSPAQFHRAPGPGCAGRAPIGANVWYGDSRGYHSIQETSADYGHCWLVCGQSSSENGPDPSQGVRDESPTCSLRMVASPGSRPGSFPLGITIHRPRPRGAGEEAGGRAGWGQRGGTYEFRRLRGGGGPPPRSPPPRAISTTVHCPGRAWGIGHFPAYSLSLCPMNSPARLSARRTQRGHTVQQPNFASFASFARETGDHANAPSS